MPTQTRGNLIDTRGFRVAAVDALEMGVTAAAMEWHRKYLPGHFTVEGGKKYGYQPRSGDNEAPRVLRADGKPGTRANRKYSWMKRRKYRHNKPLVLTGYSEQAAKAGAKVSIRKTSNRVRAALSMALPTYFYQYRKDLNQPNKYAELTRVLDHERDELDRVAMEVAERELRAKGFLVRGT